MFPETGQVLTVQDTSLTATEVAVQRLKEALPDLARRVGETELPADVRTQEPDLPFGPEPLQAGHVALDGDPVSEKRIPAEVDQFRTVQHQLSDDLRTKEPDFLAMIDPHTGHIGDD